MKPKRGSWIVTAPVILMALAYFWFGFLPGRKAIADLQGQLKSKQQVLEQSQLQGAASAATQQSVDEVKAYAQKWGKQLPGLMNTSALFGSIHELANGEKLTTTRFSPESPQKRETFTQIPIVIQVLGPYAAISRFLTQLEAQPLRIWVESAKIALTEKAGKDSEQTLADIRLVVFANNLEESDYVNRNDRPIN